IRTRESSGLIVLLSSQHRLSFVAVSLEEGRACLKFSDPPNSPLSLCLRDALNDGAWHAVTASRFGSNLELSVDMGDGAGQYGIIFAAKYSAEAGDSSPFLTEPQLLQVHRQEGVLVGGMPVFDANTPASVTSNLKNSCLDDLRLDGHALPLPPYYKFSVFQRRILCQHSAR
ncbi:putative neural-cadherin 2, partial [Hyalella azteca]|uniref:Neural-cadherin 2 n=1 Tax=Hyalella azteca TaxID=294128 RepID=A0A979FTK9_HYAAZ